MKKNKNEESGVPHTRQRITARLKATYHVATFGTSPSTNCIRSAQRKPFLSESK